MLLTFKAPLQCTLGRFIKRVFGVGYPDRREQDEVLNLRRLRGLHQVHYATVIDELRAKGPYTQVILGVTVVMDVVVIILFGFLALFLVVLLFDLSGFFFFAVLVDQRERSA